MTSDHKHKTQLCCVAREREREYRTPACIRFNSMGLDDITDSQGWGSMIYSTWHHAIGLTSQLVYTNAPGLEKPELF